MSEHTVSQAITASDFRTMRGGGGGGLSELGSKHLKMYFKPLTNRLSVGFRHSLLARQFWLMQAKMT